jgi:pimeloyl-ACP methyl ester carboxylesterase
MRWTVGTVFQVMLLTLLAACTSTTTRPITTAQGQPLAGSVASLEPVLLGGVRQWVLLRGRDASRPLLLKLHGGPGQAELATAPLNAALEQDFVVVEWDQRGAGKSAAAIQPESAMTVQQLVADTLALTRWLLQRFPQQRRVILLGHSWGSLIGLLAVRQQPQLYAAFVSTGQMVDAAQAARLGYRFVLDEALARHDQLAMRQLRDIGPPPFDGEQGPARRAVYQRWLQSYGGLWHNHSRSFDPVGWMLAAPEYAWPEKLGFTAAADKSFDLLAPQMQALRLIEQVPQVQVPVFFAVGRHDQLAAPELTRAYFDALRAPCKHWQWFEDSAHFPQWEEPEAFHQLLLTRVLPVVEGVPAVTPSGSRAPHPACAPP